MTCNVNNINFYRKFYFFNEFLIVLNKFNNYSPDIQLLIMETILMVLKTIKFPKI